MHIGASVSERHHRLARMHMMLLVEEAATKEAGSLFWTFGNHLVNDMPYEVWVKRLTGSAFRWQLLTDRSHNPEARPNTRSDGLFHAWTQQEAASKQPCRLCRVDTAGLRPAQNAHIEVRGPRMPEPVPIDSQRPWAGSSDLQGMAGRNASSKARSRCTATATRGCHAHHGRPSTWRAEMEQGTQTTALALVSNTLPVVSVPGTDLVETPRSSLERRIQLNKTWRSSRR